MEIKDYLRIFGRFWWVIVVLALIGAAGGWAWWQFTSREYQSTATLFVATQNGTTVTEAYQNNLFSTDRANSYASLATSEQVAARAVDQLKANISPEELRGKTSAIAAPKTVLLNVTVTDSDPTLAQTYANAVSNQLVSLVGELETSRRGGTPAAGAVVVDEADYPTKPVGMSLALRIAIGAAAGALLGIIAALVAGVVDKRVRGRERVEDATSSLVVGTLPEDPARASVDVVDLGSNGLYVERLRELRTNLRFAVPENGDNAPAVLAVTSPSHEDGRTTTAIDLAAALAESSRSVVLVDGDLRNPQLTARLPLNQPQRDGAAARGLSTTLIGETNLAEAVVGPVKLGSHTVTFLPAGPTPPRPGELWATDRASELLDDLSKTYDYVVIDTPPLGSYNDGAAIAALSEGAILLARIRKTTTTALTRAVQVLKAANVEVLGTVVTFEPGHKRQLKGDAGVTVAGTPATALPAPAKKQDDPVTETIPRQPASEGDGQGLVGADAQAKSPRESS